MANKIVDKAQEKELDFQDMMESIIAEKAVKEKIEGNKKNADKAKTVQVETRKDVKTFYFPPEAVKGATNGKARGFTVSGYEQNGIALKVFLPQNADGVEVKQLRYSKKLPNWLVVTVPADVQLKTFHTVEDKKAPNWERMEEGPVLGLKVLEKLQAMYSTLDKDKENGNSKDISKDNDKEEIKASVKEGAAENENEVNASEKAKAEDGYTIWVDAAIALPLKDRKGFFVSGFDYNNEKLSMLVPTKAEHVSSRRMGRKWYLVTADKEAKFELYRKSADGKAYEVVMTDAGKTLKVGPSILKDRAYKQNREKEAERKAAAEKSSAAGLQK